MPLRTPIGKRNSWSSDKNYARLSSRKPTRKPPASAMRYARRKPRMNLDSLLQNTGEWLRGNGPDADIVISSRIRLARNMSSFPFTNRASVHQKSEIDQLLRDRLTKLTAESP